MNVLTYTSTNTMALATSDRVETVSSVGLASIEDRVELARTVDSASRKNIGSAIQKALWFPAAVLLTGSALVMTLVSVVLIATLEMRDKYFN